MKNIKIIALTALFTMIASSYIETKITGTLPSIPTFPTDETANTKAQQLVDAINKQDVQATLDFFAIKNNENPIIAKTNKKINLILLAQAIKLVPDMSASVRCMASNPDCGISPTRKVLLDLQTYIQGLGELNESFIQGLFSEYFNLPQKPVNRDMPQKGKPFIDYEQPLIGSDPATHAPQVFKPEGKFSGDGLVGNYFKATAIATIHDPSGKNSQSYSFHKVKEISDVDKIPNGFVKFGSFLQSPQCPKGRMCVQVMTNIILIGKLQPSDVQKNNSTKKISELFERPKKQNPIDDDKFYNVSENQGFRAPDDSRFNNGKSAKAQPQINNNSNKDVKVSFFDKNKKLISTQTIATNGSFNIPQDTKTIKLGSSKTGTLVVDNKTYRIIADAKGNLSIKTYQIYY